MTSQAFLTAAEEWTNRQRIEPRYESESEYYSVSVGVAHGPGRLHREIEQGLVHIARMHGSFSCRPVSTSENLRAPPVICESSIGPTVRHGQPYSPPKRHLELIPNDANQ
jgi:hypothetical protein